MNTEVLHNAVMRHRRFTHRMHRHMGTLGWVTADRLFYRPARGHMPNGYRLILTGDFAQLQRLHQTGLSRNGLRHHHQTGSVFIQTVHDARARDIRDRRIVMEKCVKYRTVRVSCARMNYQVARLVDHQNVIIFIDDVQWDILRLEADFLFDFSIDGDSFPT